MRRARRRALLQQLPWRLGADGRFRARSHRRPLGGGVLARGGRLAASRRKHACRASTRLTGWWSTSSAGFARAIRFGGRFGRGAEPPSECPRAMIRAHLRRFVGGGRRGPLRILPQSGARAKPALEAEHSAVCRAISDALLLGRRGSVPLSSAGFAGATIPGGRFRKGGEAPLRVERTGSTPRVRPSGAALQLDPSHRSSHRLSPKVS